MSRKKQSLLKSRLLLKILLDSKKKNVRTSLERIVVVAVMEEEVVEITEVDAAEMERDEVDTTVVLNLMMTVSWLPQMNALLVNVKEEEKDVVVVVTSTTVEEPRKEEKVTSEEVVTEEAVEVEVKVSPDKREQTRVTKKSD